MAIGERIHFFRNLRGLTQKQLGAAVGFRDGTADVRIAQYETGARTPKAEIVGALAKELMVSPAALTVPDIDTDIGLIHTLFTLEDTTPLKIGEIDGELCIRLDKHNKGYITMFSMLNEWKEQAAKLAAGEITKEQYDAWRYNYHSGVAIPSKEFSDYMVERFRDFLNEH